jgi:hypothetical protein
MRKDLVLGKLVVLVALGVPLLLLVESFISTPSQHSMSWPLRTLILIIALHLYYGFNWAKWVIGCLLLASGLFMTYLSIAAPTRWSSVLIVVILILLAIGLMLLLSRAASDFLGHQRSNRTIVVSRVLKGSWVLLLIVFVIQAFADVWRLF